MQSSCNNVMVDRGDEPVDGRVHPTAHAAQALVDEVMTMKGRGAPGDLTEIRDSLRRVGLRATSARVSVLRVLRTAATPLSHAEVADQIEFLGIDRATIFRNLTDLTEHQLARRLEVGGQVWRFEAVDPGQDDDGHPHFTCMVCGKVTCLHGTALEAVARRIAQEVGRLDEVLLRGVCRECET